ncbi:MAG: hypothetical protein ACLSDU_05070 [Bifidobacterium catenulatum]|nr:hypothetical protein [Bifidobacterium catenulatum]MDH7898487.1 hypothetical protein [Bifidobacterium catenulatum subsp. kashiwanohense]
MTEQLAAQQSNKATKKGLGGLRDNQQSSQSLPRPLFVKAGTEIRRNQ